VGAILAVAFVLINVVADKLRLWSGIAWIIVAGIIITLMLKGKEPGDELRVLITVFAFLASAWYCVVQYRKEQGESSCPDLTCTGLICCSLLWLSSLSFHTICSGATFGS
jgi:hypothetical protein